MGTKTNPRAIAERSPKEFEEEIANIEFTTKPLVMTMLQQLQDRGRVEGRVEGKILQSLKTLLNLMLITNEFSNEHLARVTNLKINFIEEVSTRLDRGSDVTKLFNFIQKELLSNGEYEEEDIKEIKILLTELFTARNK